MDLCAPLPVAVDFGDRRKSVMNGQAVEIDRRCAAPGAAIVGENADAKAVPDFDVRGIRQKVLALDDFAIEFDVDGIMPGGVGDRLSRILEAPC